MWETGGLPYNRMLTPYLKQVTYYVTQLQKLFLIMFFFNILVILEYLFVGF